MQDSLLEAEACTALMSMETTTHWKEADCLAADWALSEA
jgi:hypothetical protein